VLIFDRIKAFLGDGSFTLEPSVVEIYFRLISYTPISYRSSPKTESGFYYTQDKSKSPFKGKALASRNSTSRKVMNFLRQELPVMVPVAAGSATGKSSSG
jgi:hypothetical protein